MKIEKGREDFNLWGPLHYFLTKNNKKEIVKLIIHQRHQYDTVRDNHQEKTQEKGPELNKRVMKIKHNHASKGHVMFDSSRWLAGPVMPGSSSVPSQWG